MILEDVLKNGGVDIKIEIVPPRTPFIGEDFKLVATNNRQAQDVVEELMQEETPRTGKSTHLLNRYVEELFKNGQVYVLDHRPLKDTVAHENLMDKFLKRLKNEHNLTEYNLKEVNKQYNYVRYYVI